MLVRRFCVLMFGTLPSICEKLLTESHPACIGGSKQHTRNPISEAIAFIGIYHHRYQF